MKKGVLKNIRPATLLKKRHWYRYFFPGNFVKFLRTPPVATSSFTLVSRRTHWSFNFQRYVSSYETGQI